MESTLHAQLKAIYAGGQDDRTEVRLDGFRIDALADDELIEIQFSSLGAIRGKIGRLLDQHRVRVVKPIVVRKQIVKLARRDGPVVGQRFSPKRGEPLDVFDDLVHFIRVFPHPNLTLDVPLIDIEELRYPNPRKRRADFTVQDRRLVATHSTVVLRTSQDLLELGRAATLPDPFDTSQLAAALGKPRWIAQRIAYCWRQIGSVVLAGKNGNSLLYRLAKTKSRSTRRRPSKR